MTETILPEFFAFAKDGSFAIPDEAPFFDVRGLVNTDIQQTFLGDVPYSGTMATSLLALEHSGFLQVKPLDESKGPLYLNFDHNNKVAWFYRPDNAAGTDAIMCVIHTNQTDPHIHVKGNVSEYEASEYTNRFNVCLPLFYQLVTGSPAFLIDNHVVTPNPDYIEIGKQWEYPGPTDTKNHQWPVAQTRLVILKPKAMPDMSASDRQLRESVKLARKELGNTQTTERGGFVYVMSNPAWPGYVKIGKCLDVAERLAGYQTGDPDRGYCVHIARRVDDRALVEAAIHRHLKAHCYGGEWFTMSTEAAGIELDRIILIIYK